MNAKRYHQALLFGGLVVAATSAAFVAFAGVFVGLIAALMGAAGLGLFTRGRVISDEQRRKVGQLSSIANAAAPISIITLALLGADATVITAALGAVLALDLAIYIYVSRLGSIA